jgi:hypothetical protein
MAIQLQILDPAADAVVGTVFTADGTALNMGMGPITVNGMLVIADLSAPPVAKPANLVPVPGAGNGVFTWTIGFTAQDNIQPGEYALYALGHDSTNTLCGQTELAITVVNEVMLSKRKQRKGKKNGKKK